MSYQYQSPAEPSLIEAVELSDPTVHIVTPEFPQEDLDRLVGAVEGNFVKASTAKPQAGEMFDVYNEPNMLGTVTLKDTEDTTGVTELSVRLSGIDPNARTLTVHSSAYEATSSERPRIAVSIEPTGLMIGHYSTSPHGQEMPLDESQARAVVETALAQLDDRFKS